jgi:amino acid adenylation domain-containing protein
MLLPTALAGAFEAWPSAVALELYEGGQQRSTLTYHALAQCLHPPVSILREHCSPGAAAVAVLTDEPRHACVSILAAVLAPVPFVLLDPAHPAARSAHIIADTQAAVLFCTSASLPQVRRILAHTAGAPQALLILVLDTSTTLTARTPEDLDAALEAQGVAQGGLSEDPAADAAPAASETSAAPALLPARGVAPADLCYIVYTSGTTGNPKGVMVDHCAIAHFAREKVRAHGIAHGARVLVTSGLSWDPWLGDVLSTLAAGATLCLCPRGELLQSLAHVILASKATHITATPALWSLLPASLPSSTSTSTSSSPSLPEFPDLRVLALGGERLPRHLVEHYAKSPNTRLLNTYGVTEATVYQTAFPCSLEDGGLVCVGEPFPGLEIAIMCAGSEAGSEDRVCAPGETGEVWIGGPQLARGYLNADDLTHRKFVARVLPGLASVRWFRTGDAGSLDMQGRLSLGGRQDNQVKINGMRVELEETEACLRSCRGLIRNAGVVKAEAPERLVAFVQLEDGVLPAPGPEAAPGPSLKDAGVDTALWLFCKHRLPPAQMPSQFVLCGSLPLSDGGKLDRRRLPAPPSPGARHVPRAESSPLVAESPPAPQQGEELPVDGAATSIRSLGLSANELRTPMERIVARAWGKVLNMPDLGPHDRFWDLGGTSLLAIQMLQELQRELDVMPEDQKRGDFQDTKDHACVRLCGLHRKPKLRDYAAFVEWAAVPAPTGGDEQAGVFLQWMGVPLANQGPATGSGGGINPEDILARMDQQLPTDQDDQEQGIDALVLAIQHGSVAVVLCLLDEGVCADGRVSRFNKAITPLMMAATLGFTEIAEVLLEHGAAVNFVSHTQSTVVHIAAAHSARILRMVLEKGGEVMARDTNKWTPLYYAAWAGNVEAIQMLLARNVLVNYKDRWGRSPLAWAVFNHHIPAAEALLAAGETQ